MNDNLFIILTIMQMTKRPTLQKNNAKVVRFLVLLSTIKYYDTIKCY